MKEIKKRFETFALFDYASMEQHLSKMAAKGWRLEKTGNWRWTYRKAEPALVTYAVTYAPDASDFNPEPTETQMMLEDYCAAAGWRKVSDWGKAQIYCTEQPDPVPIETDEEIRLQSIRSSMQKSYIPSYLLLLAVFIMQGFTQISTFRRDPVEFFAGGSVDVVLVMLWGLVLDLGGLLYYFVWSRLSEKSVRQGGACVRVRGHRTFTKISWIVLAILAVNMVWALGLDKLWFFLAYGVGFVLIILAVLKTRDALKKRGVSKGVNILVFVVVDVVLAFTLVGGLVWSALHFDLFERESAEVIETDSGWEWNIYHDDLPIRVEDFQEVGEAKYSYEIDRKETVWMGKTEYRQYGIPTGVPAPDLYYDVVKVKAGFLYDFCLDAWLLMERDEIEEFDRVYHTENAAVWDAEEAYRLHYSRNNEPMNSWLLCTGDYLVRIRADWELTDVQKSVMLEKLGLN